METQIDLTKEETGDQKSRLSLFLDNESIDKTVLYYPTQQNKAVTSVHILNCDANRFGNPWNDESVDYQINAEVEIKVVSTIEDGCSVQQGCISSLNTDHTFNVTLKDSNVVVSNITRMNIRKFDASDRMFNDALVDFGLLFHFLELKANGKNNDDIHIFSSFLYTKWLEVVNRDDIFHAYEAVHRWTKNVDIMQKKYLFFPIYKNVHWFLVCFVNIGALLTSKVSDLNLLVDNNAFVVILDSLPKSDIKEYEIEVINIIKYLTLEFIATKLTSLHWCIGRTWFDGLQSALLEMKRFLCQSPKQPNWHDCGVYTVENAKRMMDLFTSETNCSVRRMCSAKKIPKYLIYTHDVIDTARILLQNTLILLISDRTDETDVFEIRNVPSEEKKVDSTLLTHYSKPKRMNSRAGIVLEKIDLIESDEETAIDCNLHLSQEDSSIIQVNKKSKLNLNDIDVDFMQPSYFDMTYIGW